MKTLWDRIEVAMSAAAVNMAETARRAEIRPNTLTNWKSGKTERPRRNDIEKVARVLGVSPDWLLTGEGAMLPPLEPLAFPRRSTEEITPGFGSRLIQARKRVGSDSPEAAFEEGRLHLEAAGITAAHLADFEAERQVPTWAQLVALSEPYHASARWVATGVGPIGLQPADGFPGLPALPQVSLDTALLQQALKVALKVAPNETPERLAEVIAQAYDTALRTRRLDKVEELVRMLLS